MVIGDLILSNRQLDFILQGLAGVYRESKRSDLGMLPLCPQSAPPPSEAVPNSRSFIFFIQVLATPTSQDN